MALTLDDVKRIAGLARIAVDSDDAPGAQESPVSPQEAMAYLEQLNSILGLIDEMQAINTKGIEPMSHGQDVVLRMREDSVTETDEHELFQSNAPQVEADLYLVPKVIE